MVNNKRALPLGFSVSIHSKDIKTVYFDGFTEVFILKGLSGLICTKMGHILQVLYIKDLGLFLGTQSENGSAALCSLKEKSGPRPLLRVRTFT